MEISNEEWETIRTFQETQKHISEGKTTLSSLAKKHDLSPFQHHVLKGITQWAKENAEQDEEDMGPDAKGLKKHNVNTVDDVKRTLKSAGVDFAGVKESGMAESAFKDKEDLDAKRKALQDIQMDPDTAKDPELRAELIRRKAALEKEAKAMGLAEATETDVEQYLAEMREAGYDL